MSRFNPSAMIFGIDYIPQLVELSINNVKKVMFTYLPLSFIIQFTIQLTNFYCLINIYRAIMICFYLRKFNLWLAMVGMD